MQTVWDKNWSNLNKTDVLIATLDNRFTQEAYPRFRKFVNKNDRLVLEVGCGTGRFCYLLAKEFPDKIIYGIDISMDSINLANKFKELLKSNNLFFDTGDIFKINFPDSYFDIVFSEGVIEHFPLKHKPNYKDALKEKIRITKPGGKVLVAVPNLFCIPHTIYKLMRGRKFEYGYEKSFTQQELVALFKEFNLVNLELTGWYPAHGFYRLAHYSKIFNILGLFLDTIQNIIDKFSKGSFTKKFGFEILIKGEKTS